MVPLDIFVRKRSWTNINHIKSSARNTLWKPFYQHCTNPSLWAILSSHWVYIPVVVALDSSSRTHCMTTLGAGLWLGLNCSASDFPNTTENINNTYDIFGSSMTLTEVLRNQSSTWFKHILFMTETWQRIGQSKKAMFNLTGVQTHDLQITDFSLV